MGKRLTDFYRRGKLVTLTDDDGDTEDIWIQKLNDHDMQAAFRKANAARAKTVAARMDHDSEEWLSVYDDVRSYDTETLIAILAANRLLPRQLVIADEVAGEEDSEWAKDGYLAGLKEAWEDGLQVDYAADPTHEEAARVLSEIERYNAECDARLARERENVESELRSLSDEVLIDKVTDSMIENEGHAAWIERYRECVVWLAFRKANKHDDYYFHEGVDAVHDLDGAMRAELYAHYEALTVEAMEGKGSPASPASSTSSESPDEEATSESSGLAAASA